MRVLEKIWQKIYNYFNPSREEILRSLGLIVDREMTPEEREEEQRKIEELYRIVDEFCASINETDSGDKKESDK